MQEQNVQRKQKKLYDKNKIKQIPILDVCALFGIPVEKKGARYWCRARSQEKDPSTVVNTDTNTFYDFGTLERGDVISFTQYITGVDMYTAMEHLADAFHIDPIDPHQKRDPYEVSDWEYKKIGLHADFATKNFVVDSECLDFRRYLMLLDKYGIPMNELREKHPKTYERILRQRALPYVRELKNEYYMDLWSEYKFANEVGGPKLFFDVLQQEGSSLQIQFSSQIKELKDAERIFAKACHGTEIKFPPGKEYEPQKDLELLSQGEIRPTLSQYSYNYLQKAAKDAGCPIRYRVADYTKYICSDMDQYLHSAFFKAGLVYVGYLEKDKTVLTPILNKLRPDEEPDKTKTSGRKETVPHTQRRETAAQR